MGWVSLEGTDAERTIAWGRSCRRGCCGGRGGRWRGRYALVPEALQERRGRHEEQVAADRAAEVQQPIVVAGGLPDEHVGEHLLDRARRARIADKVGAELAMRGGAERHVVAYDLHLFSVFHDRGQRIVGGCRLDRVIELDVGELRAADDALLGFD